MVINSKHAIFISCTDFRIICLSEVNSVKVLNRDNIKSRSTEIPRLHQLDEQPVQTWTAQVKPPQVTATNKERAVWLGFFPWIQTARVPEQVVLDSSSSLPQSLSPSHSQRSGMQRLFLHLNLSVGQVCWSGDKKKSEERRERRESKWGGLSVLLLLLYSIVL